ncbi:lysylphosphatidylglycerol synthase transmembrane domain-containing protein [Paenibacillus sp. Soil724D2]|uniref:lysylphosphatidylglycerol synthase transmembrane domain-containing protein n=1 Tax=Paenibacillus sp. (strain Soil724D2) TaxID=1736392 RepID=UPI000712DDE9|nr:lysylphosphatidylglycerol synthase transmembrane domain-containing protein [Paenibacillus sp. Soil724D2]KRE51067.1 hypothetical protein ASG85_19115 [Paenibacillus sp. Soil724D2]
MKKWGVWSLLLSLGLGILIFLIFQLDLHAARFALFEADFGLLLTAIAIQLFLITMRAVKWYVLTIAIGGELSLLSFAGKYLIYFSISSLTPMRSADVFAPFAISTDREQRKRLYIALALDRLIEGIVLLVLCLVCIIYLFPILFSLSFSIYIPVFLILLTLVGLCIIWILKRFKSWIIEGVDTWRSLSWFARTRQIALNLMVWMLDFSYLYLIIRAIGKVTIPFLHSVIFHIGSIVFSILTFVPMGIGTGAISYVYLAKQYGYPEEVIILATISAKLIYLLLLITLFIIGLIIQWMNQTKHRGA